MFIDSHCHIDDDRFLTDRAQCIANAEQANIKALIVPAISKNLWSRLEAITQEYTNVYPAYGLHPMAIQEHKEEDLEILQQWLLKKNVVAVGECGLDFFIKELPVEKQLYFFKEQLKLAKTFDLPLIIHARKSVDIIIREIRHYKPLTGVIHSFSGSLQQAEKLIDLNFYLGFGGPITYTRANRLHNLIKTIDLKNILLETDAPDQPSQNHTKQRNEPAFLPEIAEKIAELKQESIKQVAKITTDNAKKLFGIELE